MHFSPRPTSPRRARRDSVRRDILPDRGFTILELLVVIGMIAVLLSILLPTLSSVRNRSRAVNCAVNERNLYLAIVSFGVDHDGFLPVPGHVGDTVSSSTGKYRCFAFADSAASYGGVLDFKVGTLWPYLSGTLDDRQGVVFCPSDSGEPPSKNATYTYTRNFSYSFNQYVIGDPADYANYPAPVGVALVRLRDVRRPSAKILVYEENAPNDERCVGGSTFGGTSDDWPSGRHGTAAAHLLSGTAVGPQNQAWMVQGLGNYCFFDGHVESISPQIILSDVQKPQSMYYPLTK